MPVTDHIADLPARPASIRDVAKEAGVSYQTVSRVINNHASVRPSTRLRVQAAISALDYRPSQAARALVSGRSDTITVLTSDTLLYGYRASLSGIEQAARERGQAVVVSVLESAESEVIEAAVERVSDVRAGSVVVIGFDEVGLSALDAIPAGVPTVALVEPVVGRATTPAQRSRLAWLEDRAVSGLATDHLLSLGHRVVHHLPIPTRAVEGERQAGWSDALRRAGIAVPAPISEPGWDLAAGYRAGRSVVADRSITAVLCGNDDLAIGLIRALHEHGLRVPDDISIIGFDDTPQASYLTPSLTTVRMDFTALGRHVVSLLPTTDGTLVPPPALAEPFLVVRESVAPPRERRR